MSVKCRIFGHEPSRSRTQLDPFTFEPHSFCRRCGAKIERDGGHWKAVADHSAAA